MQNQVLAPSYKYQVTGTTHSARSILRSFPFAAPGSIYQNNTLKQFVHKYRCYVCEDTTQFVGRGETIDTKFELSAQHTQLSSRYTIRCSLGVNTIPTSQGAKKSLSYIICDNLYHNLLRNRLGKSTLTLHCFISIYSLAILHKIALADKITYNRAHTCLLFYDNAQCAIGDLGPLRTTSFSRIEPKLEHTVHF